MRRARVPLLLALVGLMVSIAASASSRAPPSLAIKNLRLFVDGTEFIVKGFNYQPTPLGYLNDTGLCSYRQTPWQNETQSACFDSDLFDGSVTADRETVAGPSNGWFRALWERDLPLIKETGANTIRLFSTNPATLQATQWVVDNAYGLYSITRPLGKEHISFLDYADSLGLKVIFPLFSDAEALRSTPMSQLQWLVQQQIDEVGNHPAVLMYSIGNEYYANGDWRRLFNVSSQLMGFARSYQSFRWGRFIPFTTALIDATPTFVPAINSYKDVVDVMSLNAGYRFTWCAHPNCSYSFTNLWSGSSSIPGWFNLSCSTGIPTLISEFNPGGYLNTPPGVVIRNGVGQMWADLLNHVDQGAIGGLYFEWNDEMQKGDQNQMGVVSLSVSCDSEGKCSDQRDVWYTDSATKRQWVWDAITANAWNGKNYSWPIDTFTVLGRAPYSVDNVPQLCPVPPPVRPPPPPYIAPDVALPSGSPSPTPATSTVSQLTATPEATTVAATDNPVVVVASSAVITSPLMIAWLVLVWLILVINNMY